MMRWGNKSDKGWHIFFAWFPEQMHDGVWVWLEFYEAQLFDTVHFDVQRWYSRCSGDKSDNFGVTDNENKLEPPPPPLRYIKEGVGIVSPPPKHDD